MNTNRLYYILVGIIIVAVFTTFILVLRGIGGGDQQRRVTLQFWGVFDDRADFERAIKNFEAQNPSVTINYRQFSFEDYENSLVDALAAGTGPDVLMIHNTWLPKHGDKLTPLPDRFPNQDEPAFTVKNFQDQFVDIAHSDLVFNNQIFGLPLYVDTLALYYNKDLLNGAGIARPSQTWEEVNADVQTLTKLDGQGNIIQSGIALGAARNINRSTDILMALMLQSGVRMTDNDNFTATFARPVNNKRVGEIALEYYTDFANSRKQNYSWNDGQHYSIDNFVEGGSAMMVNYSHQYQNIKSRAPRLNFSVAPLPQASLSDVRNYGNYWAAAVSNKSIDSAAAWKFAIHLTSKEGSSDYLSESLRPSARRDLIELQKNDLELGVFATQALSARSWHQIDASATEKIFADMIDDVNFNRSSIREAVQRAESRVQVLMSRNRPI